MFKLIARETAAIVVFGVLTTSSFGVNAETLTRPAEMPTVTVRYADLDLNTPDGVEALYARLRAAAREVCGVRAAHGLVDVIESKSCYRRAFGAAADQAKALTP